MLLKTIFIFILIDGLVFAYILYYKKYRQKLSPKDLNFIKTTWRRIDQESNHNPKQAILEADKLLDFILTKKGYTGSLGQKLKKSASLFHDINGVWTAHKLRNQIAHELDFQLSITNAQKALNTFRKALNDLKINL